MINLFVYAAISVLIYGINLLIPLFMKRSILFGVRLPTGSEAQPFAKTLKRRYRYFVSAAFLVYLAPSLVILEYGFSDVLFEGLIFGQIILYWAVIYYFNRKALRWKKDILKDVSAPPNVTTIDTAFRQGRLTIPTRWFLLPLGLVAAHFVFVNKQYEHFPQRLAVHYNLQGQADRFVQKSWWAVNRLPFISLGIVLLMLGIFFVIRRARQEIDPSAPEISLRQDRRFRYIWSVYVLVVALLMSLYFFYFSYAILLGYFYTWLVWAFPAILVTATIGLAIYTGQSGYRLKTDTKASKDTIKAMRDDDRYWIAGIFYCNKNDPALFVEKRIGVGWTINFCNVWAVLILIAILFLLLLPLFL